MDHVGAGQGVQHLIDLDVARVNLAVLSIGRQEDRRVAAIAFIHQGQAANVDLSSKRQRIDLDASDLPGCAPVQPGHILCALGAIGPRPPDPCLGVLYAGVIEPFCGVLPRAQEVGYRLALLRGQVNLGDRRAVRRGARPLQVGNDADPGCRQGGQVTAGDRGGAAHAKCGVESQVIEHVVDPRVVYLVREHIARAQDREQARRRDAL